MCNAVWGGEVAQRWRERVGMASDLEIDGSCQLTSLCFDHVNNSLTDCESQTCTSQCRRLVQQRPCHVSSCLCDNACKRSLATCIKSKACDTNKHTHTNKQTNKQNKQKQ